MSEQKIQTRRYRHICQSKTISPDLSCAIIQMAPKDWTVFVTQKTPQIKSEGIGASEHNTRVTNDILI